MKWLAGLMLLAAMGCGKKEVAAQCSFDADCGEMAICDEAGTCKQVECLTSTDCRFGDYCSDAYSCDEGCGNDLDCEAGETCDTDANTCEAYACRTTDLDCEIGEYCDDGSCEVDGRGHCERCQNNCPNGECVDFGSGKFCLVECKVNAELTCPRGFQCADGLLGTNKAYCYADCPTLVSEGLL